MMATTTASSITELNDLLAEDMGAVIRSLYRMRPDLLRAEAWVHVEAACIELSRARQSLKNKRGR